MHQQLAVDDELISGGGPGTVAAVEIVLKPTGTAGKSGGSMDLMMFDLGVALSRALQWRDSGDGRQT